MLVHQQFVLPVTTSGRSGLADLSADGTGWFGSGLFGDNWGMPELVAGGLIALVGAYAFYAMFHQAKQTKYRAEAAAGRRRKKRASAYREKAKRLEAQTTGFGGLFF